MTVTVEGYTTLTGNPQTILHLLKEARLFDADMSDEAYIETIRETAQRCFETNLEVTGNTPAERAESILRALAANGMIRIEEEEK